MKKVLITGANSYIGTSFENFNHNNFDIEIDSLDMLDPNWRDFDFSKYDSIIHLAAIVHQKEKNIDSEQYFKINRDLAIEVAKKAKNSGVKQFVFMSSMSVYGIETGVITKNRIPTPKSLYGKSKFEAEKILSQIETTDFKLCIIRPPMVYGDGCKGNYGRLIKLSNLLPIIPTYKNKRSMISISNLCLFLNEVIINDSQGVFLPQDEEYICTAELMHKLRKNKAKSIGIFNWLIYILVKINKTFKKVFGDLVYEREQVDEK